MKKRWLCLFAENDIGVLARITGLFSAKSYNVNSLTAGTTEDGSVSRITISLISDDMTFEQIKKQLNRCVEVIKVIDYSDMAFHLKELMFIKITHCNEKDMAEIFRTASVFDVKIIDCNQTSVLIQSVHDETRNDDIIALLQKSYGGRIEITRGGGVAAETISLS